MTMTASRGLIRLTAVLILWLLTIQAGTAYGQDAGCNVAVLTNCGGVGCENLAIFSATDGKYVQKATIKSSAGYHIEWYYTLSPKFRFLAFEESSQGTDYQVRIFEIKGTSLQEVATLPEKMLRFDPWSPDGNKLLLQDMYMNGFLAVYDLTTESLVTLPPKVHTPLDIYDATWSPDGKQIAFVAEERLFPQTEYGINGVLAAYIMPADGSTYQPFSSPKASVVGPLIWLSNDSLVFATCQGKRSSERTGCQINMKMANNPPVSILAGDYWLHSKAPTGNKLLVRGVIQDQANADLYVFDPDTRKLTRLNEKALTYYYSAAWSPDGDFLSYIPEIGGSARIVVFDLRDLSAKTVSPVEVVADVGDWHPDSRRFIFGDGNAVRIYNSADKIVATLFSPSTPGYVEAPKWVCSATK